MTPNATMIKFGYPATCIRDYNCWSVLIRPQQATLGSLVLVCREDVQAFADISEQAFLELKKVTQDATQALSRIFSPDKFNYLMLMMVDPDVHFHLLPRYATPRFFLEHEFRDPFWPKPVDLTLPVEIDQAILEELKKAFQAEWR